MDPTRTASINTTATLPSVAAFGRRGIAAIIALVIAPLATGQAVIERSTFSSGGGTLAVGNIRVVGTVAQSAVAAPMQSGAILLEHGFWSLIAAPPCPADLNADGAVNTADLTRFLGQFGRTCAQVTPPCADFNNTGTINTADLTFFLGRFGSPCP